MNRAKQFVVLNIAALIGCVLSLFIVPGNTILRNWAVGSAAIVVLLNFTLYKRHQSISQASGAHGQVYRWVIWIGFALLILDALASRYLR